MHSLDKINEYVTSLCQEVRWKKAHLRISKEMTNHIVDGRDTYVEQGLDEQSATERAIADTGDATIIGSELDRIHRPRPQWTMFAWVAVLLIIGVIASMFLYGDFNLLRHILGVTIGIALMLGAYYIDFTIFGKYSYIIYGAVALLTVAILFLPFSFVYFLNQHRLDTFRIVESFTLLFPLVFASVLFRAKSKGYVGGFICWIAYGLLCVLSFWSHGSFFHFAIIGAALFVIAALRGWFGVHRIISALLALALSLFVIAVGIGGVVIFGNAHVTMRLLAIFNPYIEPYGAGWLPLLTREILSGAVLLGEGHVNFEFLPSGHADFLLTSLISRFGWLPFAVVLSALLFFIFKATMRCWRQKSGLGFLVSTAIVLTFSAQTLLFVAWNMGVIFAQISLPLISSNYFAMIINLGLIGFMLSVFRTGDVVVDEKFLPIKKAK